MGRSPLPIGTWGLIRTYPVGQDENGKPKRYRAMAKYRDFDGVTRGRGGHGKRKTQREKNLRQKLKNRTAAGRTVS